MTRLVLTHAWRMIAADWGKTIRIAALPWVALVVVIGVIANAADALDNSAAMIVLVFPLAIAMITCSLWVLVGWHRYVLLGEAPNRFGPVWHGGEILNYFGYALLIGIILAVPMAIVEKLGASSLGTTGLTYLIYQTLSFVVICYVSLRISLVLPSAAVGGRIGIGASWQKTGSISPTIWGLSAVLTALYFGLLVLETGLGSSFTAELIILAANAVISLLGASILTTLYGYLVEGRALQP